MLAAGLPARLVDVVDAAETRGDLPKRPPIASPNEALNVFDFESVARQKLPPAHFGYLATGVDDDLTLRANRDAFSKLQIRARRLVDVSRVDTSVELFGTSWTTPIALAPVGAQKAFHPDGETAVARAASARGHLMILSTGSTTSLREVTSARGGPVWYQLYPTNTWRITEALVMKVVIKGLETREDAELAVRHGAEGIIVSNHGGRAQESGRGTIECLPEVVEAVRGKIPVLVDGGFRRGTDIFKALALGAKAVCIGRPYVWGLAAFGQPGVDTVLAVLTRELELMMRHAGATSLARIDRSFVVDLRRGQTAG